MTDFYDVGAIGQVGLNLFHGYGYNFYRDENQLRADDQKVRTLVCTLLGQARQAVAAAEGSFRRERIPLPSREHPFPPADIVAQAKRLEALGQAIGNLEGRVRHAPVPENDRMTQRYRAEAETLRALVDKDTVLAGQAETLRAMLTGQSPDAILAIFGEVESGLVAIGGTLAERQVMTL